MNTLTTIILLVHLYDTPVAPNVPDMAMGSLRAEQPSLQACKTKGQQAIDDAQAIGRSAHYACLVIVRRDVPAALE